MIPRAAQRLRSALGDDKRRRGDRFREPQLSESLNLVDRLHQAAV
jgi:hypothetical protein